MKAIEPESRIVVAGKRCKGGNGELLKGFRVSVLQSEKGYGDWLQKKSVYVPNTTEVCT